MTDVMEPVYGPPVTPEFGDLLPSEPTEPNYAEQVEQLNVKINELTDMIDSRDNDIQMQSNTIERMLSNHRIELSQVRNDAVEERDAWFVEQIFSFDQGCMPGKISFVQYCDLPLPTKEHYIQVRVNAPMGMDMYTLRGIISAAVEGYLDDDENSVEFINTHHDPSCPCGD